VYEAVYEMREGGEVQEEEERGILVHFLKKTSKDFETFNKL
jgi:hypothetical protein